MTTTKLLPITTFVAAAMSFALPAYADDYTWAGEDSSSRTYLLRYLKEADEDSSAIKLGEKILEEDPLTFALHDTHAVSEGSDGFARGSISASSEGEILEQVEITQSTFTNLNRALTLAPATNSSSDTVTVRQSAIAMSPIFEEASEQYTEAKKSYYEQVSTSDSGSAVATYSTVSLLGNFDSLGNSDTQYGISYLSNDDGGIDSGIVYYTTRTWRGGTATNDQYYWSTGANWTSNTWSNGNDDATFDGSSDYRTVTVNDAISVKKIAVTGDVEYTFEYLTAGSLSVSGNVTIGNASNDNSSLTITGGTNSFLTYVYLGYASNSTGTLTITGGTNSFSTYVRVGYAKESTGTLNITGGTNTFSGAVRLGNNTDATGKITITDGINNFNGKVILGYNDSSTGIMEISGGQNNFSDEVDVGNGDGSTGTLTITGVGTTSFTDKVYVGNGDGSTGTMNIKGGTNTFSGTEFIVGYNSSSNSSSGSSTGYLNISGGTNTFEGSGNSSFFYVGMNNGTGIMKISGGNNTFSVTNFIVGHGTNDNTGTLEISGGENTFSGHLYIGYDTSSIHHVGTMTITGGNTTISGASTLGSNSCELSVSGGTLTIKQKIGTDTTGSVTFSDAGKLILSGELLNSVANLANGTGSSVAVITANTISFGNVSFVNGTTSSFSGDSDFDSKINQYVSAEGYQLSWRYDSGTLYVVSATPIPIPEPSMFGLFFSLSAIGLVATRRRRRA